MNTNAQLIVDILDAEDEARDEAPKVARASVATKLATLAPRAGKAPQGVGGHEGTVDRLAEVRAGLKALEDEKLALEAELRSVAAGKKTIIMGTGRRATVSYRDQFRAVPLDQGELLEEILSSKLMAQYFSQSFRLSLLGEWEAMQAAAAAAGFDMDRWIGGKATWKLRQPRGFTDRVAVAALSEEQRAALTAVAEQLRYAAGITIR